MAASSRVLRTRGRFQLVLWEFGRPLVLASPIQSSARQLGRHVAVERTHLPSASRPGTISVMTISRATERRLFAASGGYCANPLCPSPDLFRDIQDREVQDRDAPTVGEMAHIIARSKRGPRGEEELAGDERDSFDNLVLLCANCHKVVDDMKHLGTYSVESIRRWKDEQMHSIRANFEAPEFANRDRLNQEVSRLLRENYEIWREYGPESAAAAKPISDVAAVWRREARVRILPNNRRILALADRNQRLLTGDELRFVERFRIHARAFARTQTGDPQAGAPRFPREMTEVFSVAPTG